MQQGIIGGRLLIALLSAFTIFLGCGPSTSPQQLCDRIAEIQSLPMKGPGSDEVYRGLMELGDAAVPCLIEKITDTTAMPDPRMAPTYSGVVVGDVAFFILEEITDIEGETMLPKDLRARYEQEGVYAYFDYVSKPSHRLELQRRFEEWWAQRSAE